LGQEGEKKRKERKKGEIVGKQALLNPPYIDFTACGCVKLLRCYLLNPQIAFLILKRFFCWYMVHWVPVYLHNLWCSICGGKCDILQKMNSA
jgi:hypothetical protein